MSNVTTRPVARPDFIGWPPALYLIAFLGGLAVNGLVPFAAPNTGAARLLGAGLLGLGTGLSLCTLKELHRYGTNYAALREARCIIRTGPFSFTRNPMYLAMAILLVGVGLLLNNLWVVISALPAMKSAYSRTLSAMRIATTAGASGAGSSCRRYSSLKIAVTDSPPASA